jgi:hypothetical protein
MYLKKQKVLLRTTAACDEILPRAMQQGNQKIVVATFARGVKLYRPTKFQRIRTKKGANAIQCSILWDIVS